MEKKWWIYIFVQFTWQKYSNYDMKLFGVENVWPCWCHCGVTCSFIFTHFPFPSFFPFPLFLLSSPALSLFLPSAWWWMIREKVNERQAGDRWRMMNGLTWRKYRLYYSFENYVVVQRCKKRENKGETGDRWSMMNSLSLRKKILIRFIWEFCCHSA